MQSAPISDPFWYNDITILYDNNKLSEFFPNYKMTLIEKLNAISRLSIYLGIGLYLITKTYQYLYLPIIVLSITAFIYFNQQKNIELFFNSYNESTLNQINKEILEKPPCLEPTTNNPFMNINLITDKKTNPPACESWDNTAVKESIEEKFDHNLYKDVSDLFGKSNSQRQYYTMPSTTIPNNQTEFAKWCFNTGPTCKEKSMYCASPYTPIESTTDIFTNVQLST
jgi:hypothetical protein